MTQLHISLPDSIYNGVQALAIQERVSIDQFIASVLGEKISVLTNEDYLSQRAKRGQREQFLAVLRAAPDVEPIEADRITP